MDQVMRDLRIECLRLAHKCQDGNLQSAFSCIDILWALHDGIMLPEDVLVISKGQATLALWAVLSKKKIITDLDDIGQFDSRYSIQVDITKGIRGVVNSAGSLGHGLPIAVGMAMANKIKGEPGRVFVLMGDGELQEGTTWEACLLASQKKLDNLCVIVDNNDSGKAMIDMGGISSKFATFGFSALYAGGHHSTFLAEAGLLEPLANGKPSVAVLQTERGHGSPTLQSDPIWFHKSPNDKELAMMIEEIEAL